MSTPESDRSVGGRSFAQMLAESAERWPHNEAIVVGDDRWSYLRLLDEATRFAGILEQSGVSHGERVGLLMPNGTEFFAALFGASMVGATVVPYNLRQSVEELAYMLADSRPSAVVTVDSIRDYKDLPQLMRSSIAVLPADMEAPAFIEAERSATEPGSDERHILRENRARLLGQPAVGVSAIIYTSGTTSRPRGAMLEPRVFEHWSRCGAQWGITSEDRFWDPCPSFHITMFGPLAWVIDHGAAMICDTFFEAGRGLKQIEAERATLLYPTYPPIMSALIGHPDFARTDLSSVRAFLNVATPEELMGYQAALPEAVQVSLYGSTEGGPVTMHSVRDDRDFRLLTNGRPVEGVEVSIFDRESGLAVNAGEVGEIRYRGPNTFSGYLGDPIKTAESIDGEGWVHTGDLGQFDGRGALHYLGRFNDMIKVGGENVAPLEVESVLAAFPGVTLCQAVGMPHPRLVEVVAAFVELEPGSRFDEHAMISYCASRMARYKVPATIRQITEWPMSATKIQKAALRAMLIEEER